MLNTHCTFLYGSALLWDKCPLEDQVDVEEYDLEILASHRKQHPNDYLEAK